MTMMRVTITGGEGGSLSDDQAVMAAAAVNLECALASLRLAGIDPLRPGPGALAFHQIGMVIQALGEQSGAEISIQRLEGLAEEDPPAAL